MGRELLHVAARAAHEAGALLLEHFNAPPRGVDAKSTPTDLVSDADRAAEELILGIIESERPQDGVVAEEGGGRDSGSGVTWIVDPLDGTVNFLFRFPAWCVSVAALDEDGDLVGVVYDPLREETFNAIRGGGAFLGSAPISVGGRDDLSKALIGTGFSYDAEARAVQAALLHKVLPRVRDIRRAGSAALDLASLACGRLDGFYEAPMEEWDKAAGRLIVREAGGVLSELPPPKEGQSPGLFGGNPAVHDQLRRLVVG